MNQIIREELILLWKGYRSKKDSEKDSVEYLFKCQCNHKSLHS